MSRWIGVIDQCNICGKRRRHLSLSAPKKWITCSFGSKHYDVCEDCEPTVLALFKYDGRPWIGADEPMKADELRQIELELVDGRPKADDGSARD